MAEQLVKDYQLISVNQLVRAIQEGRDNAERFCFIVGAGASESSGIPTGISLESTWMKELEESAGMDEIREAAKSLKDHLDHDFAEIERDWENVKKSGGFLSSEYYFDIYKLRFFPNHRNGYHYLEKIMANKDPGFGYHPLALMLTDGGGSNLVITPNFDSLIEDALFLYTDEKPLVINHELLAEYAGDPNIKRPIIAKVHRGIFFDPLNRPEETNALKGKWRDVLASVFQSYTPIVIGYGGGDNSLMNLLEDRDVKMKNGIYWCYFEKYGLPNEKIQALVQEKNGYLVRTAGFDATMLAIGNALFPDRIGVHEAEEYLNKRTSRQIAHYEEEYNKLTKLEDLKDTGKAPDQTSQSETDFKTEIEKMVERTTASEQTREKQNQMTAWDHRRQGNRHYNEKQYREAVESYTSAIKLQSNVAQFYNDRGHAYNALGEYKKAIRDFDKAIELDPQFAIAYNNRGYAYVHLKDHSRAIANYEKATELDPQYAVAYNNWGHVYSRLNVYDAAIPYYTMAIELNPGYAMAYSNRGYAYANLGQTDKAQADYEKAISLKPQYAKPYKHFGVLWKERGDLGKAVEFLSKAIELSPEYKEAYTDRAEVYRLMGEEEKAKADQEMAAKLRPTG